MNNKYIIFGEEHFNPLGLIRSLGENGIKPIAIIIKNKRPVASKSKYISKLHIVNSIQEGYELLLKEYGTEKLKPFVFTSDDQVTSYLDARYEEIKKIFYFYNAGEANRISYFMNKDNINNLAIKHGLNVAKSWSVDKGEIPEDIEYPIMTKAIISTIENWKDDVFICNNDEELKKAYKNIKSKKILLQKYIQKKDEIEIEGFVVNRGKNAFYAVEINLNYILEDKYSHYTTVKNFENIELQTKINEIFKEIGFEGIFEVEFLVGQDDKLYFLEINFRPSAWNYSATVAKMPLPLLWAEGMNDASIVNNCYKEFKEFTAMSEPDDFRNRVKTHKIGFLKWLKQMLGCKCLYYINKKDMKPFWSIINVKLKGKNWV